MTINGALFFTAVVILTKFSFSTLLFSLEERKKTWMEDKVYVRVCVCEREKMNECLCVCMWEREKMNEGECAR